jgi:hypothetical protein
MYIYTRPSPGSRERHRFSPEELGEAPISRTQPPQQRSPGSNAPASTTSAGSSQSGVPGALFQWIQDLLRMGKATLVTAQALISGISAGIRDMNELTNRIFFSLHPERKGRSLKRGEPHFAHLAQTWLKIRDSLVRPALTIASQVRHGSAPPASTTGVQRVPIELASLKSFTAAATAPTVENALNIMKIICGYHKIPWRIGYTILGHEGGVKRFKHPDGVMQTIKGARDGNIPRIPRGLKLALLGLPPTDRTLDEQLTKQLHKEFPRRIAIQIATGIQELTTALQRFNGYVALAFSAYNTGRGSVALLVTNGKFKTRPRNLTAAQWEEMCRVAASLLHQRPGDTRIEKGIWLCDPNLRTGKWIPRYGSRVYDKKSGRRLTGYQYLRSIRGFVPSQGPTSRCDFNIPKKERVHSGSGELKYKTTRPGSLDKLYDPQKLGGAYYTAAQHELPPIVDDNLPLKVFDGGLVKVRIDGSFVVVPG